MRAVVIGAMLALSLTVLAAPPVAASGSAWSIQATPNPVPWDASLNGVSCLTPSDCIAVGHHMDQNQSTIGSLAEHWDGIGWTVQPTPWGSQSQSILHGVSCMPNASCLAVGSASDGGSGHEEPFTELLIGGSWVLHSVPLPAGTTSARLDAVSCPDVDSCVAVGSSVDQSGNHLTLIETWNGSAWQIVPSPTPDASYLDSLGGVSCPSRSFCEAVGSYDSVATGWQKTLAETWDGSAWSIQPSEDPVDQGSHPGVGLVSVSCPTTTSCLAVGTFMDQYSQGPAAEHWDGTRWTLDTLPGHSGGAGLLGVSCAATTSCVAVGYGSGAPILRWDGGAWNLEPGPNLSTHPGYRAVSCVASCTAVGWNNSDSPGMIHTLAVGNGPVNPAPTTTSVTSSGNPSTWGQDVKLSATIAATDGAGIPTGTVTFSEGAAVLGQAAMANGVATLDIASLSAGSHTITASYLGDSGNLASSAQLVQSVASVSTVTAVASSANPSVWGQALQLSATVAPTAGTGIPKGTVTFSDGSATLGQAVLDNGVAVLSISNLSIGTHTVTASYVGDSDSLASSGHLMESVTPIPTATSLSSSANPIRYGDAVNLAVNVASAVGTSLPTGTVSFTDGSSALGTATLSGGTASLSIPNLGGGTRSITATYSGDPTHAASSASLSETVERADTHLVAASTTRTTAQFSATLTRADTGAPVAGETVLFTIHRVAGQDYLCQGVTDANGIATCSTTIVPPKALLQSSYGASFAGSSNYSGSAATAQIRLR